MNDPYLVRRLDHPLLGDVYLATIAASGVAFALADWGFLMGLLCGVALGIPAIFLTALASRLLASPDTHGPHGHRSRLLACLVLAATIAALTTAWVGLPGLLIGAAVFAVTAGRAQRRDRRVPKDRSLPDPPPPTAIADRP